MSTLREQLEQREREILAPQAAKSADSRGRLRNEKEDDVRPAPLHGVDVPWLRAFRMHTSPIT